MAYSVTYLRLVEGIVQDHFKFSPKTLYRITSEDDFANYFNTTLMVFRSSGILSVHHTVTARHYASGRTAGKCG